MWSSTQRQQHVRSFHKKLNGLTQPSHGNLVDACQAVAHSTCASKLMMLVLNTKLHMYVHVYNILIVKVNLLFVFGKYKYCFHKRREENQLDATECFIALIICSTCFGHNFPHPRHIACCSAPNSRPPATKALHTICGNNTSIVSTS